MIDRVIFHRKNTISDMETMISYQKANHPEKQLEYEAFILNEKCHFTGAFCNTLHCDELAHMCRVPYRMGMVTVGTKSYEMQSDSASEWEQNDMNMTGVSGCGLCSLWKLRQAGVTHLKLVSRGNYIEDTIRDIKALRTALTILGHADNEPQYVDNMKKVLFPCGHCSGNCYYTDL